ncbi:TRAP-type mannitol/chloroaromatic compound transport system, small permease component [Polaromonas sp. OV174]|uniref:TRAP transporter small permease subunit n=1 Tax=Polaromonas sp. OV174 TaxID=1855300 RepID=UPI0008E75E22|nr:TRAP transporter small permease subunit [Polaromonas sp. OV174]SFC16399.1 TRAP-type mannitol/chloroaromatic compound transport system, small permease component [Polaromonas sp. OV174]
MNVQRLLHAVDQISTWVGKAFAWLIVVLMLLVCAEVFKRYALNAPTAWIFDANNMLYGTLFMMGGAYTLAHDGHVRGDFFYGSLKPRTQAWLDLVLYLLFFLPGIAALTWSGWTYFNDSWSIHEQTFNADPIPLYPFKLVIPLAGAIVLMQGIAEMIRCMVCIRTGAWTPRLKDAEESDVVAQQLAGSEFVDEEAKRLAIEKSIGMKG